MIYQLSFRPSIFLESVARHIRDPEEKARALYHTPEEFLSDKSFGLEQCKLYENICLLWFYLSLSPLAKSLKQTRALIHVSAKFKKSLYRLTWQISKGIVEDRLHKGTLWTMLRGLNACWELCEPADLDDPGNSPAAYYIIRDREGRGMPRWEMYRSGLLTHLVQQKLMVQTPETLLKFLTNFHSKKERGRYSAECIIDQNHRNEWQVHYISGTLDRVKELRFYARAKAQEVELALRMDDPWRQVLIDAMDRFPNFVAKPESNCYLPDNFGLDRLFAE